MPPLGLIIGGVNFTDIKVILKAATEVKPAVTWNIGNFLQTVFDFLVVALAVFIAIKGMMQLKKKELAAPVTPPVATKEEILLTEIRDLLKK
jgi:large conductance mechanosensitive channel